MNCNPKILNIQDLYSFTIAKPKSWCSLINLQNWGLDCLQMWSLEIFLNMIGAMEGCLAFEKVAWEFMKQGVWEDISFFIASILSRFKAVFDDFEGFRLGYQTRIFVYRNREDRRGITIGPLQRMTVVGLERLCPIICR